MAEAALDLDELRRQTGGDEALTREVLQLFLVHAPADLERLRAVGGYERRVMAHRLVGSARGVGAIEVGRLAASVETGADTALPALADALDEAVRFIRAYLAR